VIHYPKILFDLEESRMALPGYLNDVAPQHALQWNGIVGELLERAVRDASQKYIDRRGDLPQNVKTVSEIERSRHAALHSAVNATDKGALSASEFTQSGHLGNWRAQQSPNCLIEWRDVRDPDGRLLRVELTTETREYWAFLASVDPNQTLQLLADFARVQSIDPSDVYGPHDPFSTTSTPEMRKAAFLSQMVPRLQGQSVHSIYNNGKRALAFMSKDANSLSAALKACTSRNLGTGALAPSDPLGIYIKQAGKRCGLLMPDKTTPVPRRWIKMSRGTSITRKGVHNSFYQRLVVEPDPESGLDLGDLVVAQTGLPVTSGADIARLFTTSLHLIPTQPSPGVPSKRLRFPDPKTRRFPLSMPLG